MPEPSLPKPLYRERISSRLSELARMVEAMPDTPARDTVAQELHRLAWGAPVWRRSA